MYNHILLVICGKELLSEMKKDIEITEKESNKKRRKTWLVDMKI